MSELADYRKEFISFLLENGALLFGKFRLKSGRESPYFVNTGLFKTGESISRLGGFYAKQIHESFGKGVDLIFGPAYKGIPLAVSTAVSLSKEFGLNAGYAFDRKESKKHGDRGSVVGAEVKDGSRVVIVDDVFTTGTTKEEAVELLKSIAKVELKGLVIAVDREEKDSTGKSAIKEFQKKHSMPVKSIISISEIVSFLHNKEVSGKIWVDDSMKKEINAYLEKYGAKK